VKIFLLYFRERTAAGFLVNEEFLVADRPIDREIRFEIEREIEAAHRIMIQVILPSF
jgi:hypothetical protein